MRAVFGLVAALLLAAPTAQAEQKQVIGNWEVHYSAFNSTFITPEIAAQYNLTRSEKRGLINIAVLDEETGKALAIEPNGFVANPRGGVQNLEFTKITEGDAIYYLASFLFGDEEVMRFTITFPNTPHANTQLNFEQQFYRE